MFGRNYEVPAFALSHIQLYALHSEHFGHGRAENVGVKQSDFVAFPRKGNGEVGGHSAFAHAAFAGTDSYYVFYSGQRIGRFFRIVAACFYRYIAFDLHIVRHKGEYGRFGCFDHRFDERIGGAFKNQRE